VLRCQIEEIEINFLTGLGIFSKLVVNYNPLTILRRHTFANHAIQIIDLSSNKIRTVKDEAFMNLPNITAIRMQNNLFLNLFRTYHACWSD
jgi:Leucine-rich repeat (LRR) protein